MAAILYIFIGYPRETDRRLQYDATAPPGKAGCRETRRKQLEVVLIRERRK